MRPQKRKNDQNLKDYSVIGAINLTESALSFSFPFFLLKFCFEISVKMKIMGVCNFHGDEVTANSSIDLLVCNFRSILKCFKFNDVFSRNPVCCCSLLRIIVAFCSRLALY